MIDTVWEQATDCGVEVYTAEEVNSGDTGIRVGGEVESPYVLTLGGDSGGCIAIEGTAEELIKFAAKIRDRVIVNVLANGGSPLERP